jgi:predicted ATPase
VMLGQLGLTLAYLGHFDQARARIDDALSESRRLGHAYTLGHVLLDACNWLWVCGSPIEARKFAAEVTALSEENGFPVWLGFGLLHHGWSLIATEPTEEGLNFLTKGLSAVRATGAVVCTPWALMMLAEAHRRLGQLSESLNYLLEAAQIIEATDERCNEAELHRLHGDLRSATGDHAAAEQHYRQALAIAQRQRAKALELRAATSLARLWRDQGRDDPARDCLATVCNWFADGFNIPILTEARRLLSELE